MGKVIVLDNGTFSCKAGLAGERSPRFIFPNQIVRDKLNRIYIGDQIERCQDILSLQYQRPHQRGFLCDWKTEVEIWDRIFGVKRLGVEPSDCSLLVTETAFTPSMLREDMDEVIFEHYQFQSHGRVHSAPMALLNSSISSPNSQNTFNGPSNRYFGNFTSGSGYGLVIDIGHHGTTCVPLVDGIPLNYAYRRGNIGGKILTNALRDLISSRYFNMGNDFYIVNDIKEKSCYVSDDFMRDMNRSTQWGFGNHQNSNSTNSGDSLFYRNDCIQYILPDNLTRFRGIVRSFSSPPSTTTSSTIASNSNSSSSSISNSESNDDVIMTTSSSFDYLSSNSTSTSTSGSSFNNNSSSTNHHSNHSIHSNPHSSQNIEVDSNATIITLRRERVSIPELLFHPSDIGYSQKGIVEIVMDVLAAVPEDIVPLLVNNILLIGGSSLFPGLCSRLERELRPLLPSEFPLRVNHSSNPLSAAWIGGSSFATGTDFKDYAVTRQEYEEHGSRICRKKFFLSL